MNITLDNVPRAGSGVRWILRLGDAYRGFLALFLRIIGPDAAYALMAALARCFYRLADPLRNRCEAQCRAALGGRYNDRAIRRIAEQAFVHRTWNLADLLLAPRYLHARTYRRYGGEFPEPYLGLLQRAQRERRPVILLTAYLGPYDLLPLFLGFNGIRAVAIYRRHANPSFDAYRQFVRSRGGCEMVPVEEAVERLPHVLEKGGTVAMLSDHHAARRGIQHLFLGLPTVASPAVALLAERYDAIVAVASILRSSSQFRFEIRVADFFGSETWRSQTKPAAFITERYSAALERLILANPTQYLWAHTRWGTEFADRLTGASRPDKSGV